ncbi:MAG: peptidylprolyl isomerase, partial [Candidatus Eisenbacteria bacterium]
GYAIVFAEVPRPSRSRIDVPGGAIEREYRTHLAEYTPPEEVRIRHILFSSDRRSAAEAAALARNARGRLARGEDFATLARELSEDPSTRNQGGDLGFVQRGQTDPRFEQAAFALDAEAPLSPPVPTTFGVHLLQLVERRGGKPEPFDLVRTRVTEKLITQYGDTLARQEAERLFAEATDAKSLVALADARGIPTAHSRWHEGFSLTGAAVIDPLRADAAATTTGRLLPRVYRYLEAGYVVAALDSLLPSRALSFEEAEGRVIADYRVEARRSAARARADRVEKDLAAGRSWREATETLGGSVEPLLLAYGDPLPGIGQLAALDSLLFGPEPVPAGGHARAETPRGTLLLGVTERVPADADVRAREREKVRRTVLNRRVYDYVEGLRAGAKIEILRPDLAERPPAPPRI